MRLFYDEEAFKEGGKDDLSRELLEYAQIKRDRMTENARMHDVIEYEHEVALAKGIAKEHTRYLEKTRMKIKKE